MKMINAHAIQQAAYGMSGGLAANYTQPSIWRGGCAPAWCFYALPGSMPSTEAEVATVFKTNDLSDLYAKCLGITSSVLLAPSTLRDIAQKAQVAYYPKGYSAFNDAYSVCIPDSISGVKTDRDIQMLVGNNTAAMSPSPAYCARDVTFSWISPVNLAGFYMPTQGAYAFTASQFQVYVNGTLTALTFDASNKILLLPAVTSASTVRITATSTVIAPFIALSTDVAAGTFPLPEWGVFAPNNTTHIFTRDMGPEIPYVAFPVSVDEVVPSEYALFSTRRDSPPTMFCNAFAIDQGISL